MIRSMPPRVRFFGRKSRRTCFNLGIDGWWFDVSEPELSGNWGEYRNFLTADGPGYSVFNAYPLMHTTTAYVGQRSLTSSKRVFILTRSAWAGQQRNAAVTWSGDINGDFPTLAEQIPAGLNFSISGIPYWTTDTGGFNDNSPTNTAYDEVFTRWFQFSTFCPLLRIHGNNNKALYFFRPPTSPSSPITTSCVTSWCPTFIPSLGWSRRTATP